jgi:hypothetical protein
LFLFSVVFFFFCFYNQARESIAPAGRKLRFRFRTDMTPSLLTFAPFPSLFPLCQGARVNVQLGLTASAPLFARYRVAATLFFIRREIIVPARIFSWAIISWASMRPRQTYSE